MIYQSDPFEVRYEPFLIIKTRNDIKNHQFNIFHLKIDKMLNFLTKYVSNSKKGIKI